MGFKEINGEQAWVFYTDEGSVLMYPKATLSLRAIDVLLNDYTIIEDVVAKDFRLYKVRFQKYPLAVDGKYLWQGNGSDDENKYQLLYVWWKCNDEKRAFVAVYKGANIDDNQAAKESILSAQCG